MINEDLIITLFVGAVALLAVIVKCLEKKEPESHIPKENFDDIEYGEDD